MKGANAMKENALQEYWSSIPVGKENALDYFALCNLWEMSERRARKVLHELSLFDNGDNYILIRSSKNKGFYRTDEETEIEAYRKECLNKGRSIFAPVRKCNRILRRNAEQMDIINNLLQFRIDRGMKQTEVCGFLREKGFDIDPPSLSRFENNRALPLPDLTNALADIYGCAPSELIAYDLFREVV